MCQNKKIYIEPIPKIYAIILQLFKQLKQSTPLTTIYSQNRQVNSFEAFVQSKMHALDSQFIKLNSLMKVIIQTIQIKQSENIQNSVFQITEKYSISDIQSASKVDQQLSQPEQSQYNEPILNKLEYTENHENNVRGPYRSYTIQEKKEVLQLHKNGLNYARISKLLQIPQKNIVRWCKTGVYRKQGAGRKIGDLQMEEDLIAYLRSNYQLGSEIKGKYIREKAKRLTKKSGFKSSKGWLKNFINRYDLNCQYIIL